MHISRLEVVIGALQPIVSIVDLSKRLGVESVVDALLLERIHAELNRGSVLAMNHLLMRDALLNISWITSEHIHGESDAADIA